MSNREWLDSLSPGDEVWLVYSHNARSFNRVVIQRRTKTRIVLDNGSYVRPSDGKMPGRDWGWGGAPHIVPLDDPKIDEWVARRRLEALRSRVREAALRVSDIEVLSRALNVLETPTVRGEVVE